MYVHYISHHMLQIGFLERICDCVQVDGAVFLVSEIKPS